MRIVLVATLTVAAACSSPRRYPAPLYAGLFVKGASHTYTVESTHTDPEGNVVGAFTGKLTCTVTDVREIPSAIASSIDCLTTSGDVPAETQGPSGIFVATADGLWSVGEMPRVAPTKPTSTTTRLFAWPPVAGVTTETDPANPGSTLTTSIAPDPRGGWCRYFSFISGDAGDSHMCLVGGIIVGGAASSDGASTYESSYELATSGSP